MSKILLLLLLISASSCKSNKFWPADAKNVPYVGDWRYWHREKGHQTTTDDVLVAYFALYAADVFPHLPPVSPVNRYVDLGCGIGSTLFLVAHSLGSTISVGIEAQYQSALLASRSAKETGNSHISVIHEDIRVFLSPAEKLSSDLYNLPHNCDLITANPPYAPVTIGTYPKVE